MKAEILAVGTELLLGDILNTNAQFLAQELANLGIEVYYQTVVGDNPQRLKDTIFHAFSRADLIITTVPLKHNLNIPTVQVTLFINYEDESKVFQTLNILDKHRYHDDLFH